MKNIRIGLTGHDAAELLRELSEKKAFDGLLAFGERDMRALWVADDCLMVAKTAQATRPWLQAIRGSPLPEVMLSTALRPGGDEDNKSLHRRLAFARAYRNGHPLDTYPMQLMKATEMLMVNEMQKTFDHALVNELRLQIEERYAYLERARKHGHADEIIRHTLIEKAMRQAQVCEALSRAVIELERQLLGEPVSSPDLKRVTDRLEDIDAGVRAVRRTVKCPPASSTAQRWILTRLAYFRLNPQALGIDVGRRRIYLRDVWEHDCEEARTKHHLADFNAYRRCHEAARKSELRARTG